MSGTAPLLGVREAAELLDVHENTVRNWVSEGLLTDARIPGAYAIRVYRAEVENLTAGRHSERITAATREAREAIEKLRTAVANAQAFLEGV